MTIELTEEDAGLVSLAIRTEAVRLRSGVDSDFFAEIASKSDDFAQYVNRCRANAERLTSIADALDRKRFGLPWK